MKNQSSDNNTNSLPSLKVNKKSAEVLVDLELKTVSEATLPKLDENNLNSERDFNEEELREIE